MKEYKVGNLSANLEPCPFCGSEDLYISDDLSAHLVGVHCMSCWASGGGADGGIPETLEAYVDYAANAWNVRACGTSNDFTAYNAGFKAGIAEALTVFDEEIGEAIGEFKTIAYCKTFEDGGKNEH